MENKCPNCGKVLPEEAAFCLYCFTDIQSFKKSETHPAAVVATTKTAAKAPVLSGLKSKFNKKTFCRIGVVAAFLLIMGICIFAMRNINSGDSLKTTEGTTIINETSTVAVTDNSGEAVTDESGEQVFDIVEVTKIATVTTTEKQGFFDKVLDAVTNKNDSTGANKNDASSDGGGNSGNSDKYPETTENKGFFDDLFDNIFGDKEEPSTESTVPTTTESNTTEEHGTTENTTAAPDTSGTVTTTKKPTESPTSTTLPTTEKTTATQPSTEATVVTPISDFEYTLSTKYASINKYNGTAKHVVIPAVIEGKYVTEVNQDVFLNNPYIEVVTFADDSKRPYLWVRGRTFNNCENLRVINLPDTDLGILNHFAYNCPKVEEITLKNNQYRYADGGLYYAGGKGWMLRYFCPASSTTSLKLPDWSAGIEGACNLEEATRLKEIILHKNVKYFPDQSILPSSLENIFVDDENTSGYDINGIAFYINSDTAHCAYPSQNKTTELTLPENSVFYAQYVKNPYLKTLRIPKTVSVLVPFYVVNGTCFKNLETVYIQDGHPNQKTLIEDARVDNIYIY